MKQLDDDFIYTHESMLQLLRYSALGAEVKVSRVSGNGKEDTSSMRCFTITVGGMNPLLAASQTHIYTLPCSASQMQKNVKDILVQLHKQIHTKMHT